MTTTRSPLPNEQTSCARCYGSGVQISPTDAHWVFRCECGAYAPGSWVTHRANHPQKLIRQNGRIAAVDELLAPMLSQAWASGIWTASSCQGGPTGSLNESWAGIVVVIDPRRLESLTELWGWDRPGVYYHDTLPVEDGLSWHESVARIRFESIEGVRKTIRAYDERRFAVA